ncbi:MAG: hypothetical protein N3D19_04255 [Archaeoglobaceae archaeon]|nr:hypothetical protein [Archaeoglobaceae archaeon]
MEQEMCKERSEENFCKNQNYLARCSALLSKWIFEFLIEVTN